MSDLLVEWVDEVCGIYFRSIVMQKGDASEQHVHDHDHATYCGSGSAELFVDGLWERAITAGSAVPVLAGKRHLFVALEDGTRLTCVHDVASATSIKEKGL